jgi:hypothetical protein
MKAKIMVGNRSIEIAVNFKYVGTTPTVQYYALHVTIFSSIKQAMNIRREFRYNEITPFYEY